MSEELEKLKIQFKNLLDEFEDFQYATNKKLGRRTNQIQSNIVDGSNLLLGQGDSVLKVDKNGIYLGNGTFASAPFRASMAGALVATSAIITGEITADSGAIGGWTIGATTLTGTSISLDSGNERIEVGTANKIFIDGANKRIQSDNYVSGAFGSGFHLSDNLLEVGNIACRGLIRTAVFQKDVVSVMGGNFAVLDGDVLDEDMTANDNSTLTTKGTTTFSVGDILRIKDGTDDEWLEITAVNGAVYTCNRDKAGVYGTGANPTWKKGATVVNYKQSGDGGVYMTASENNAPYLSVFEHSGSPWTDLSTKLRIGKLDGFLGYPVDGDKYGIAIGTSDYYLKYDPTNHLRIKGTITIENPGDIDGSTINNDGGWTDDTAAIAAQADATQAIADASGAQATADGKVTTFYQTTAPTAEGVGDLWVDIDNTNKLYRWSGSAWTSVVDTDIAQAIADAGTAQTTADGKIVSFYQTTAPTAEGVGDFWTDTDDDNKLYRWSGSAWVSIRDAGIATAIANAATAQATADSKIITFYQAGIPTSTDIGDLWIDTDDGNKLYRAECIGADQIIAGEWVEIQDTDIAQAIADAGTAQSTADSKIITFYQDAVPTATDAGDLWFDTNDKNKCYRSTNAGDNQIIAGEWEAVRDTDIGQAITNAATAQSAADTAQATADGKVVTFYQDAAPTAEGVGDLWVDTNDTNKLYRWSGSAWVSVVDSDIAQAISDAAGAQSTADGKIVTFYQDAEPTADGTGDIWFDTNDKNKQYRWSGSAWVEVRDTDIAQAITDASNAQATADGKIISFFQDGEPTGGESSSGDLWIDTNDGNKLYRYSGAAWVEIQDNDIATAITNAATAQTTADGKIVTFIQPTAPTAEGVGDFWIDSDDDNKPHRWNGSAWISIENPTEWANVGDNASTKPADSADVTLSAINGGLAVTGGGITLDAGGAIKGGQTDYATGTGWFLGYSGGEYKFSIGDANNHLKWNGTRLIATNMGNVNSMTAGETVTGETLPMPIYINSIPTSGETLDASQQTSYNSNDLYSGYWFGQSFKISSVKNKLEKVSLYILRNNATSGDIVVNIHKADVNGRPTGSILGTKSIAMENITSGWNDFEFTTAIDVIPAEVYVIVASHPSCSDPYYAPRWRSGVSDGEGEYADGHKLTSTNSGGSWSINSSDDMTFRTYTSSDLVTGRIYICKTNDISKLAYTGFVVDNGNAGDTVNVQFNGILDDFTGLDIGSTYYVQNDGTIGTSVGTNSIKVGRAISATQLLIYQLAI